MILALAYAFIIYVDGAPKEIIPFPSKELCEVAKENFDSEKKKYKPNEDIKVFCVPNPGG